jgi:hypothetical protein
MLKSNAASLKRAVAAIAERIRRAKSVVALPAFTVSRLRLQKEARQAIEALGCPFVTTTMEKCIIDESHPQFADAGRSHGPLPDEARAPVGVVHPPKPKDPVRRLGAPLPCLVSYLKPASGTSAPDSQPAEKPKRIALRPRDDLAVDGFYGPGDAARC